MEKVNNLWQQLSPFLKRGLGGLVTRSILPTSFAKEEYPYKHHSDQFQRCLSANNLPFLKES